MLYSQKAFISFDLIDAAGILFFSHVFTLAHHLFETSIISHLDISWNEWFNNGQWIAPIKQCEANYHKPLLGGQKYDVKADLAQIGDSSFTLHYSFCLDQVEYCSVKIVHVFCDKATGKKASIPADIRRKLERL